ncbi:MAG: gamma carbonic anhydrase family protein [Lachnospiraceae bacterium]
MHIIKQPVLGKHVYLAQGAIVQGDVTLGENCSVWFHAVIRAEAGSASIGKDTNIQDNAVIHVDHNANILIGNQVTIGHGAIVHGCTIGDNTLIGMGAIILNHAVIGKNCMIGAGTLVTQNTIIPDNSLVIGNPGKVKRQVSLEEIESIRENAAYYIEEAAAYAKQK